MIMVEDDRGFVVRGTVPRSIERALIPLLYAHRADVVNVCELVREAAVRIRFTATVERVPDDQVGLDERPTDAVLLGAAAVGA